MSAPGVVFIRDGAVMAEMLRGPNGMVMRNLVDRATRVQLAARAQVKATTHGSGKLAAGIVKRPMSSGVNPMVQVGAWNIPYAVYVHEGTLPHDITPKNKKALAFMWTGGGFLDSTVPSGKGAVGRQVGKGKNARVVNTVLRKVHHPGTRANPYLADNLHLAVE
jgi:hypothetical protein